MQLAFYFNQTRCTGCYACGVACKDWHDVPAGSASWRRVETIERGQYPDVFVAFLSTSCYHYEAPQFGAENNPKMQKCDMCLDRWEEGDLPICVAGCPLRALDAGPIDQMRAKYGQATEAVEFSWDQKLKPSIVFKPKEETSAFSR